MKIPKIEVSHIEVPLKKPFGLSTVVGIITHAKLIVVKVFTDEGIIGIGETDPLVPFTEETPETIKACLRHYLGPILLGADPTNIVKVHEKMDRALKLNTLAKTAIDKTAYHRALPGMDQDRKLFPEDNSRFLDLINN